MINIKKYRGLAGLNQKELAKKLGITRQYVCAIESSNTHNINPEIIKKICNVLNNCTILDLYGIDNLKYEPENDEQAIKFIILIFNSYIKDKDNKEKLIKLLEKETIDNEIT